VSGLPRRSHGVLSTPLADRAVVYDLISETRHYLNLAAGAVLGLCDGKTTRVEIARSLSLMMHTNPVDDRLPGQVDTVLEQFSGLGLIDRHDQRHPPVEPTGSVRATARHEALGGRHRVLDLTIRFRSNDRELLADVDSYLGTDVSDPDDIGMFQASHAEPGLILDLRRRPDGEIELTGDRVATYDDLGTLQRGLVIIVNEYAAATHRCVALHAGAARAPDGQIVVLPAVSSAGKSTLTAALVAAGWDYLGDEAIGVDLDCTAVGYPKRIAIDLEGRALVGVPADPDGTVDPSEVRSDVRRLGGRVGPISQVIFPTYRPGSGCEFEELDVYEHFDALLANTLNLARIGQAGLDALCALAEAADGCRLVHGDAIRAGSAIAARLRQ